MKVQIKIHSTPTIKMSTGEIVRIIQPVPGVVYKDELRDLVITDGVDKEALDVS